MFKTYGCAPRGIVRDRRQQTGRPLSDVRGGQDTASRETVCNSTVETTERELYNRVIVWCKGSVAQVATILGMRWSKGQGCYEVIGTKAQIAEMLAWMGDRIHKCEVATHRAHGPSLQQSRPYHRR